MNYKFVAFDEVMNYKNGDSTQTKVDDFWKEIINSLPEKTKKKYKFILDKDFRPILDYAINMDPREDGIAYKFKINFKTPTLVQRFVDEFIIFAKWE